jgi:hypothetical protein
MLSSAATVALADASNESRFTYSWPFLPDDSMRPRGGTTKGPDVTLDKSPGDAWRDLRQPGLGPQERDRRAILAMAGAYRTSFDFIETVGFVEDYEPTRPYQSWGTEYVYVVEDREDFVSLQHIIVMFFENPDGEIAGPAVVKHWRQDWQYEDDELHVFVGHDTWERRRLSASEIEGTWSQSVYQVDDSPRYQAIGRWQHDGNHSSWISDHTWRPLPRREFSVRDDYHVLAGTNRHTITPRGWVHEEDNLKAVLDADGNLRGDSPYLAREAGLNRYERIVDHDFSAGDAYWSNTGAFWSEVRAAWQRVFEERDRFRIRSEVDGKRLFEAMFSYAGELDAGKEFDADDAAAFIAETLARFIE